MTKNMKLNSEQLLSFISQQGLEKENQKQALSAVFHKMLFFFNCDRAWCLYPCDPEIEYWGIPIEATQHEWPGVKHVGLDMPTVENDIATFNLHLNSNNPITIGKDADYPVPDHVSKVFGVKSQISSAIYPKQGKPWMLGIHFCEKHHHFTDDEIELFDSLGKKIGKAFDTLIFE